MVRRAGRARWCWRPFLLSVGRQGEERTEEEEGKERLRVGVRVGAQRPPRLFVRFPGMRREREEAVLVTSPVSGILKLDAQYVVFDAFKDRWDQDQSKFSS